MSMVYVQMQIGNGIWRTYNTVINNSQFILHSMTQLSRQNPNKRIRAVDFDGRVVDIL